MKVLAINGSARKDGNTARLIRTVFTELEKEGIATELIQLSGMDIRGCTACGRCITAKNGRCALDNDPVNGIIAAMAAADGIILGSPTYFADCTAQIKALLDRAGYVSRSNGDLFRRKAGAAIVAVRRAGAMHAFDTLNHFFTIAQMFTVGSDYWNIGIGREIGAVENDAEGLATMRTLGANMAWLLKRTVS